MKPSTGKVMIHGKEYETVASRLKKFITENNRYAIDTTVTETGPAALVVCRIKVFNDKYEVQREVTGTAHEIANGSGINKTSHIENGETSALGRALAFLGYAGTEIASADEVENAVSQSERFPGVIDKKEAGIVKDLVESLKVDKAKFLKYLAIDSIEQMPKSIYPKAVKALEIKSRRLEINSRVAA